MMNEFVVDDTAKLQNQNLKYETATQVESCVAPNTAKESSKIPMVSSSTMHGVISIRTIPTAVQMSASDKQTILP